MQRSFDIAVIGGGVVGLAILRRFAMAGLSCVLLERGADILSGASKGNSALLHTGFDAPPGSLELACMQAGYAEYLDIREPLNLPLVKSTALVDAWSAPLAYAHQALAHGAVILRNAEVTGGDFSAGQWTLASRAGAVTARIVINAAGNFGDLVEAIARPAPFAITPRRGQFVVFDKPAAKLVGAIILPVPTERTKGVVLFRTAFGNLAIGPTAEDVSEREVAATDTATLERLKARAHEMVPSLAGIGVNAIYAGLRPASDRKDYVIEALPRRNWITVGGIRSTGLTACLGIARHVAGLYAQDFGELPQAQAPIWTPVPNLAEERPRPYMQGGEIVCHCEWVTRGEIAAALEGPLPAGDLGGLKRRTRAMMGRCQGFNCSAHVEAMMREKRHGTA